MANPVFTPTNANSDAPVIVIGAGPAGLACAQELVAGNRRVVLIDDNIQPGGQYFRQLPPGYSTAPRARLMRDKARYDDLARVLDSPLLTHLPRTTAWSFPQPGTVAHAGPLGSGRIAGSAVVIATGAQERSMPFPGWTLPGVISAGGCLNLAKAHGLVPEGRVVVAGNGPLVLVAAATMAAAGARVTTVAEAQQSRRLAGAALSGVVAAPGILAKAAQYRAQILRAGAAWKTGWMVSRAHGDETLREVSIAPVGPDGRPDLTRERTIPADLLVLGYGLMPGSDAARLLGCRMELRPDLGGLVPVRGPDLQTSTAGVYAVGDGAGIGGVEVALIEGRLAAHAILGTPAPKQLAHRYRTLDRFRRALNSAYVLPTPLRAADDDTIICRCEELRLRDLKADGNAASGSLNTLKTSSRLGMGRCQGRNCLHTAAGLLGLSPETMVETMPRFRPPLRPVPLARLAADRDAGPAREPDEIILSEAKD
ncbi:FAD-dependent oxidoreductase [Paracoccus alkenifer]|uniref:Pyruvate/2-oxoglutarate dehydrogenase complex, dihydrolipoamide dehydrogenase (E3) component n=1 Tax=Paracoccus alkenifer TaxID=65735 RepID=A0A1H6KWP8_9RHOB|nr:FAD-dependent oxidoreductase [Paracoccus alkenifer]SEH78045.1 Pyruvate/2-oxoglutarate dehydrogenase complex, dihydrolipoamide dehydrogenase (E3) component [Paracoccus alkenifer]